MVDGPALRWLARQDRPRIWVSDGVVTGVGDDNPNPAMLVEVARIIARSGIRWISGLNKLPKRL